MSAEPLTRQTLRAQVERVIREAILFGEFEPGQRLSEPDLAKRFEVSLTPVREALGALAGTGLVVRNGRQGTHVRTLGVADVENLLAIREALEVLAIRQAIPNFTAAADQQLMRLVDRQIRATELAGTNPNRAMKQLAVLNEEFHQAILDQAANDWLATMLAGIHDLFVFARARLRSKATLERRQASLAEHRRIVGSIAERDAEAAARFMSEHIRSLKDNVLPLVAEPRSEPPADHRSAERGAGARVRSPRPQRSNGKGGEDDVTGSNDAPDS